MFAAALTAASMSAERRAEMIMWAIQILLAVAFGAAGSTTVDCSRWKDDQRRRFRGA
jgi:hypothetical protein